MRKFAVVAATVVAVLGITAVAYAVTNTYSATSSITPSKSGTAAKPTPVSASLTFHVGEVSNQRPSALKTYSIGLGPGVVPNTNAAPGCSFNAAAGPILPSACKGKAIVGGGSVSALAGTPSDPTVKLGCYLTVTLVNSTKKNHLNIRIDGVTTGPAGKTCVASQHTSIDASYVKTGTAAKKGGGTLPVWAIRFSVPNALLHPPGLGAGSVGLFGSFPPATLDPQFQPYVDARDGIKAQLEDLHTALELADLFLGQRGSHDPDGVAQARLVQREHVGIALDENHPPGSGRGGAPHLVHRASPGTPAT